ncbi:MAG: hypothetical protein CL522_00150 [Actinobacteria bacterium]|nr:hypothetical protein [Actinomycetota bacterium]
MIKTVLQELLALALRKRKIFRVGGNSMIPVLQPDDLIFVRPDTHCYEGDIVAIRHPHKKTILIKHVKAVTDDHFVELRSPKGTDSRQFGNSPIKHLVGVATFNYSQKTLLTKTSQAD